MLYNKIIKTFYDLFFYFSFTVIYIVTLKQNKQK